MSDKMKRRLSASIWVLFAVGWAVIACIWYSRTGDWLIVGCYASFAFLCLLVSIQKLISDPRAKLTITMATDLLLAALCVAGAFAGFYVTGDRSCFLLFGFFACAAVFSAVLRFLKAKQGESHH